MVKTARGLALSILFTHGIAISAVTSGSLYGISLGTFGAQANAIALKARLESSTCSLIIRTEELPLKPRYRVVFGPFNSYMDAWATHQYLPATFPEGRFITEWTEDSNARPLKTASPVELVARISTALPQTLAPDPVYFVTPQVPGLSPVPDNQSEQANIMTASSKELLSVGFQAKTNSEGASALKTFLQTNPNDALANAARIRLARRLLAQKDYRGARALLTEVLSSGSLEERKKARLVAAYVENSSSGSEAGYAAYLAVAKDTSLEPELRSHALRLAAGTAHAANAYTSAVLAYRQIASEAPSHPERHEAQLQLIGLQIELVGRGKGTWDEVISSCNALCDDALVAREIKATANMMRFETMFHAGYKAEALAACEAHLRLYPDIRREYIAAKTWYGALLVYAGRREEAKTVLHEVLDMDISKGEKFGSHEPKARAAYWLGFIAAQAGDASVQQYYVHYITSKFPHSTEAQKAHTLQSVSPRK